MGLDQYLNAKIYLWRDDTNKRELILKEFKEYFNDDKITPDSISFSIHTWRKSNAIHGWFVDNVQEGNDDCGDYYVSTEKLKELLEIINKILGRDDKEKIVNALSKKEICEELLPNRQGFFFGTYEYDEWYFEDLRSTKEMLERILNSKWIKLVDIYYSSSW